MITILKLLNVDGCADLYTHEYEYKQHLVGFVMMNDCIVFCSIVEDDNGFECYVLDEGNHLLSFDVSYKTYDECYNEMMDYFKAN